MPPCPVAGLPGGSHAPFAADGEGHANMGALVAASAYSDGTWTYCSGTLISPTVFLTAAHRYHDHGRRDLPVDERRLPARHRSTGGGRECSPDVTLLAPE